MQSYMLLFLTSFTLCCVIILSSSYGFNRRAEIDAEAVQSAHRGFVPRVGGLAVYLSIFGFIPFASFGFIPLSVVFGFEFSKIAWLIFSAIPVFVVGLSEDLGYRINNE